ncbi:MAG: ribonuclease III [Thomasclavelia sp.]|nr:ribonuclease III [Thomasclavelia sp.]
MDVKDFLNKLDIKYDNLDLYVTAFTHSSYSNEKGNCKNYERLEFLGDAVLQYYVSKYIFDLYRDIPEGSLTTLRSKLVREESLARFARELNIPPFIRLGYGEEHTGGRKRDSIQADIFEAFIGALSEDDKIDDVLRILNMTIYKHVDDVDYEDITDYKTTLQEVIQSDNRKTVEYEIISSTGPSNNPEFIAAVKMDEIVLGTGKGGSKKKAQQQAAKDALDKMAK